MENTSGNLRISVFRHRLCVWVVLFFLSWSCVPAVSFAQQPTATITAVSGIVLVNGQQQQQGTILNARDILETQPGASIVLTLSDGSTLEVGEKTQIDLSELRQTATQARVSRIKLMWGWVRAKLSPDHQHAGSSFDIETPNAVIGVKFSQPDVEVSYDPAKQETIGIAHTVELIALNLVTNERIVVPVGSSVVIIGLLMKVIVGTSAAAIASEVNATEISAAATGKKAGIGTGAKVVLGLGAVAAVGGGVALGVIAANQEEEQPVSFTGTFRQEDLIGTGSFIISTYSFAQDGTAVTGTYEVRDGFGNCTVTYEVSLTGTVNGEQLVWSWPFKEECCPCYHIGICCTRIERGNYSARLFNDGNSLNVSGPPCTLQGYACVGVASNATRQ